MFAPSRNGKDGSGYDPGAYGRAVAEHYDDLYSTVPETDDALALLAELAGDGGVLEMGIGTGRLALPLSERGVAVAGIDGSPEMVDELRAKPGGEDVPVAVGDFADTEVDGRFSVVLLALHTIFGLPTPERQIRCFQNAAAHLKPGGVFVVEARVLDPADFRGGQAIEPRFFDEHHAEIQIQRFDPVTQRVEVTNVHLSDGGVALNAYVNQYTTPREFDLMARIAGLTLRDRWESWRGSPSPRTRAGTSRFTSAPHDGPGSASPATMTLAAPIAVASPLPGPAGPLSTALFAALRNPPHHLWDLPAPGGHDDLGGDDLHRALYACCELAYGGFADVDGEWEWEPSLVALRVGLERRFEGALVAALPTVPDAPTGSVPERLTAVIAADEGPSVAHYLAQRATDEELREFLVHRSAYLLKEADPHVRTIPRLPTRAKAALVEMLADEYGGGRPRYMHSELYRQALIALGLDRGGAYVDHLPGVTLATVNLMSMFGAHARWRGALVGHLAVTEMTSSEANRRYGRAVRRLGHTSREATHYFDEHVEADGVHDVVAAYDFAGGLAEAEPEQADAIVFGARTLLLVEGAFARHLLGAWKAGRSSLRTSL